MEDNLGAFLENSRENLQELDSRTALSINLLGNIRNCLKNIYCIFVVAFYSSINKWHLLFYCLSWKIFLIQMLFCILLVCFSFAGDDVTNSDKGHVCSEPLPFWSKREIVICETGTSSIFPFPIRSFHLSFYWNSLVRSDRVGKTTNPVRFAAYFPEWKFALN